MTMTMQVKGIEYTNFMRASCDIRLDALCNKFSFVAAESNATVLPIKGGDSCVIFVDGEPVVSGSIESVSGYYDSDGYQVIVSGRDKTADILDSSLSNIDDIRGQELTLKQIIEIVIDHLGLNITVIDQANPAKFNSTEDIAGPEPGENAFQFIEKYSRKRQVLLTSNSDGNIVIASNSGQSEEGRIQHLLGANDNNVISAQFTYDATGRFNVYRVASGLNPIALNLAGDTSLESVVDQSDSVSDDEIRTGRQMVLISETSFSSSNCLDRAKWERNIRRARALSYSAVVPGYRVNGATGKLWQVNRLYSVVDDFLGKEQTMLCNSVTHSLSIVGGSTTTIGLVGKDAYTLLIPRDPLSEIAGNVL